MFKSHMAKMDALIERHLGDAMQFVHGTQTWPVAAIPDSGESTVRLMRSSRPVAGVNKTIELSLTSLPPVPWRELKVQEGSAVFQVIDRDVDSGWVRLYLVAADNAPTDQSESNAFTF